MVDIALLDAGESVGLEPSHQRGALVDAPGGALAVERVLFLDAAHVLDSLSRGGGHPQDRDVSEMG